MRFPSIWWVVVFPFGLSMCGESSREAADGGSGARAGQGGTSSGTSGNAARGGASSGTDGEAGAAGDGGTTGGAGGVGGSSGAAGAGSDTGGSSGVGGDGGCESRSVDVLVLLDRSASMQDPPEEVGTTARKWDLTVGPLIDALSNAPNIRWGLKTFPEDGPLEGEPACAAGSVTSNVDVPIGDDNVEAVEAAILATVPAGDGTPTGDAVLQAAAYLQALDTENPKYILLVTDGEPSCANVTPTSPGTEGSEVAVPYAIEALADTFAAGIPMYVLGIGTNKESARLTLNAMAEAGGRPAPRANPLDSQFYLVNDAGGAGDALDSALGDASSCGTRPPGTIPLPYAENFESGSATGWRFTGTPWSVVDDGGDNVFQLDSAGDPENSWAVGGDRHWTDVRVEMRVKFVTDDGLILLSPRWQTLNDYMFVEYEASDHPKLRRRFAGSTVDLVTSPNMLTFALGQWHTVVVTLAGATATLEIDGVVLGSATDAMPVPKGGIGITVEEGIVAIDDVRVTAP